MAGSYPEQAPHPGQVVNPDGFPAPTRKVGKQQIARPYTTLEEKVFRLVYRLPGPANRSQRLWIACGSLGAGLRGNEIAAAHTSDIEKLGDGRLAVRVRGTEPATGANPNRLHRPRQSSHQRIRHRSFVPTDARNIVHNTVSKLEPRLSLRRARSTWLLAHLTVGTPLAVLRMIAGPLSANTLDGLLPFATNSLDEETAALGALGA